ncbi:MAG: polysaccharide pyruvyl transferase family protein, partial [Clostridia bacterium]|nr:polysaccharide pyruvyl transferase family protein [Clostridia bacterium]
MGHARAGVLRFLVSGYYGFGNAGDEAILAALVSGLRSEAARLPGQPEVDVVVLSGRPEETAADHGVRAIPRTDFVAVARAVAAADVVLSGGGSLLQDVTSHKNIPYYLAIVALGLAARRRTMAYAQGVGPVGSWAGRAAIRAVLDRVDLITTRDPHSAEFLRAIGVERPPIEVTADASLLLEPDRGFFVADALAAEGVNPDLPSPIIG